MAEGEILGFLGPNGAGKTTTVKMLTGQLKPKAGKAILLGMDVAKNVEKVQGEIGVCFEETNLYEQMSAIENLRFFARLFGIRPFDAEALLRRVGLAGREKDRVDSSVKCKLEMALKNPDWVIMQSTRHTEEKEIEGIKRQLRLLNLKISQAESGIATIQDHIERQSGIYTPQEAERRIANYRGTILKATRSKEELETSLNQITQDKERSQRTKDAFRRIHSKNIKRSTFADWLRIVEILDAKVYPSEDWFEITVTTAIDLAGLEDEGKPASCYNTNIASPKL